jgi:hypothetical protein
MKITKKSAVYRFRTQTWELYHILWNFVTSMTSSAVFADRKSKMLNKQNFYLLLAFLQSGSIPELDRQESKHFLPGPFVYSEDYSFSEKAFYAHSHFRFRRKKYLLLTYFAFNLPTVGMLNRYIAKHGPTWCVLPPSINGKSHTVLW